MMLSSKIRTSTPLCQTSWTGLGCATNTAFAHLSPALTCLSYKPCAAFLMQITLRILSQTGHQLHSTELKMDLNQSDVWIATENLREARSVLAVVSRWWKYPLVTQIPGDVCGPRQSSCCTGAAPASCSLGVGSDGCRISASPGAGAASGHWFQPLSASSFVPLQSEFLVQPYLVLAFETALHNDPLALAVSLLIKYIVKIIK